MRAFLIDVCYTVGRINPMIEEGITYSSELINDTNAVLDLFRASGWQEDADFNMISSAFVTGLYCSA